MFCFLGGGRVFASSWIWFCIVGEEKLKAETRSDHGGKMIMYRRRSSRRDNKDAHWDEVPATSWESWWSM